MIAVHIALRYLRRRRMAWLAMAAVLLTVMVSVVVLGVMEGWVSFTRIQVRAAVSDLTLRADAGIPQRLGVDRILTDRPEVRAAAPYIETPAPAQPIGRSGLERMIPIKVDGVDWQADRAIGRLTDGWLHPRPGLDLSTEPLTPEERGTGFLTQDCRAYLPMAGLELLQGVAPVPGALPPRAYPPFEAGFIAGRELVYEHMSVLWPGDRISITLPDGKGGTLGRIRGEISDTIGSGVLEIDRYAMVVPLDQAQRLTDQDDPRDRGEGPVVDGYRMALHAPPETVRETLRVDQGLAAALSGRGGSLLTWQDLRGNAVRMLEVNMRILRIVMFALQGLCVFTVAAVFSTLVAEKRHDIGVLLGIGVHPRSVIAIFLIAATVSCAIGGLIGWGLGWGILAVINPLSEAVGYPLFPQSVFYTSEAPIHFDWRTPASFIAAQAAIGLVSALIPAIRAGLIRPIDTIREQG